VTLSFRTALLLTVPPLCWAANAVIGRAVVGEFPPLALSLLRWVLALLILAPFVGRELIARRKLIRSHWQVLLATGALGVGAYNSFQYLALQTSPALNVTLIASSAPVFVLVAGALFFGERIRGPQALGAAVSIFGVLVVLVRGEWARLAELRIVAGDLWMLAAAASWAVYTWLLRTRRPSLDLAPFLAAQIAVGSAMIAPLAGLEALGGARIAWSAATVAALLFVAVFPSLVAYWCWDRGVARAGAVLPVYFANLTPVFAALLGGVTLDEVPRLYHAVGLVLIVIGIHLAARHGK
jgi:drug/metabolite transporter (DMT)-like permease